MEPVFVFPVTTKGPKRMVESLLRSRDAFAKAVKAWGPGWASGPKSISFFSLKDLPADEHVEGKVREPCHLGAFFDEPLAAEECLVDKGNVHEVPGMGMLGVDPAKTAFEFAALDLERIRQRGCDEVGFFKLHVVLFERDRRIETEVGIDRREERQLGAPQIGSPL
ncbi:MAG: hypothetical protein MZW92_06795 [Comamonadaceae bacterium]|nr:hypothetical protein [Comamonadaceae bacterium]